jgi:hypothetical protein
MSSVREKGYIPFKGETPPPAFHADSFLGGEFHGAYLTPLFLGGPKETFASLTEGVISPSSFLQDPQAAENTPLGA